MKKIAIIIPGYAPVPAVKGGAIETLITNIIESNEVYNFFEIDLYTIDDKELSKYNYKNTKIVKIRNNFFEKNFERLINHFLYKFKRSQSVSFFCKKVINELRKNNYDDIIIENNMFNYKKIQKKLYSKCKNFIFHLHNDIGKFDKPINLCNLINKTSTKIITCSDFLTNRFKEATGSTKTFTLYNTIEMDNFNFSETERATVRDKYNLKDCIAFGYVGRISSEKGILELIKAFKNVLISNNNAKLLVVGGNLFSHKNSYYKKILKEIKSMKDSIIFVGEVQNNEVSKYMSAMDCVVIPTVCEEAFGVVAVEAMRCSRPLIVSDSGGLVEVVDDNCALIFKRDNFIYNLTESMNNFCKNKDKLSKLGINGFNKVKEINDFKYDSYIKNFYNLINRNEDKDEEKNTFN